MIKVSIHQWSRISRFNPKLSQKMVLDAALLNTQHYKVKIKRSGAIPGNGIVPSSTPQCGSY